MGKSGKGKTLKKQGLTRSQRKQSRNKKHLSKRKQEKIIKRMTKGFGKGK